MSKAKAWQIVAGIIAAAVIWFVLIPLLTGVAHTIAIIIFVVVLIFWVATLGGLLT